MSTGGRPLGATVSAILEIVIGAFFALGGALASTMGSIVSGMVGMDVTPILNVVVGIILLVALVNFAAAWGILTRKGWGRVLGLILAALGALLGLLALPGGLLDLIINGVILYYLTRPNVVAWFSGTPQQTEVPPPPPPTA